MISVQEYIISSDSSHLCVHLSKHHLIAQTASSCRELFCCISEWAKWVCRKAQSAWNLSSTSVIFHKDFSFRFMYSVRPRLIIFIFLWLHTLHKVIVACILHYLTWSQCVIYPISPSRYPPSSPLFIRVNNLARIQRCCTIMGRKETDEMSAAQIFYPCMQAADVFFLKADICQLGMDQRKVNMLAR